MAVQINAKIGNKRISGASNITLSSGANPASASVATAQAAFDAAFGTAVSGLAALLGSAVSYSSTTHLFSGVQSDNATITPTQTAALAVLLNAASADLIAAATAAAGVGTGDVSVVINTAGLTKDQLKAALLEIAEAYGTGT